MVVELDHPQHHLPSDHRRHLSSPSPGDDQISRRLLGFIGDNPRELYTIDSIEDMLRRQWNNGALCQLQVITAGKGDWSGSLAFSYGI
ncbi:unnamed protein product [Heligmosomoides polygyrus]|uniref:Uncharacterized protein n=1 Tax=Heligmosomoides polygyrus TaxID=6339 RepID=A0A183F2P8_HELPZ|nr:unnamed protein product [Heligmosomoides polygyrus]